MKTKIVLFLSLLCAAAHGAALNDLTDVQRPFASSSSIGSLKWRLPAKYARIEGERLVVDIPESAYPADAVAVAEVKVSIPGVLLSKARCHITDAVRTHTEVPLVLQSDGSACFSLMPDSFALIEVE